MEPYTMYTDDEQKRMRARELHNQAQQLWQREGGHCVSHLVSTLAQGLGTDEAGTPLADLVYQALELASPIDDWESAAREAGWTTIHHHGAGWRAVKNDAATDDDVTLYTSSEEEAWRDACEQDDIEPHQNEVYEHWIVSDWLADKLEAKGEKVDKDFAGLTIWARTTTGQAVFADGVMEAIAAELHAKAED